MFKELKDDEITKVEKIYKPEEVILYFDIYLEKNDDSKIMEIDRSFWGRLKRIFCSEDKTYRKKRTIKLNISTASCEKITTFMEMMIDDMIRTKTGMDRALEEITQDVTIDEIYVSAITSAIKYNNFSDEVMRHILGDIRLDDGFDFIPNLTLTQRGLVIEAFWQVNPILNDAQKKILEVGREVGSLQKSMTEIEKAFMRKEEQEGI